MKKKSMDTHPTDQRKDLILIARQLVRESGMAAFNLRVIAEQAETSTQAIYTLFGGKGGMIQALYQHWILELEQRLLLLVPHSTPVELLLKTAHIYREQALSDPELFLAGTSPIAAEADVLGMMYDSQVFSLFVSFLEQGVADQVFQPISHPPMTAKTLWAAVHGAVLFELCTREPLAKTNMVDDLLPIMLRGLA